MSNENKVDQMVQEVVDSKYVQKLFRWTLRLGMSFIAFALTVRILKEIIGGGIHLAIIASIAALLAFFLAKRITS